MTLQAPFKPVVVSDVNMAFPAYVMHLLPAQEEIPAEFHSSSNPWHRLAQEWFMVGLPGAQADVVDGIDGGVALRHLRTVLGSFQPQHEHKIAAVAFLCSQWFSRFTWDGGACPA